MVLLLHIVKAFVQRNGKQMTVECWPQ